jgi:hypothetical protein
MPNPEGINQYTHGGGSSGQAQASHKAQQEAHKEQPHSSVKSPYDTDKFTHHVEVRDKHPGRESGHPMNEWGWQKSSRTLANAQKTMTQMRNLNMEARVVESKTGRVLEQHVHPEGGAARARSFRK